MSALEDAALEYGSRRAIMLLGKRPAVGDAWPDWSATPGNVRAWIAEHEHNPAANVGIRTGDGLVALDIDPRHDGHVSLDGSNAVTGRYPRPVRSLLAVAAATCTSEDQAICAPETCATMGSPAWRSRRVAVSSSRRRPFTPTPAANTCGSGRWQSAT
jgi:hypothetical protein